MTKETLFELYMNADHSDIRELAEDFENKFSYDIIKKPSQGLVVFRAEETVEKLDFNLGEILMTTAEVKIMDKLGFSMIMGMDEEKALDCALIMAVYELDNEDKQSIEEKASFLLNKKESQLREEREIISSTRVHFEVMGGQDPNVQKYHQGQSEE